MSADEAALEAGMSYVEKLDFREQAHRHELERIQATQAEETKRARYRRSEARQDTLQIVGIAVVIGAVILGIVWAIYQGTRPGPYSDKPSGEERRETACIADGGGWVPGDLLDADVDDHGICVYPGRRASTP